VTQAHSDGSGGEAALAAGLLEEMSAFAAGVGDECLENLPRHLGFREALDPADIRRETMVAILYSTRLVLAKTCGAESTDRILEAIQERFVTTCLGGNTGEFKDLGDLLANRFERYARARKDPMAKDETVRSVMMGIVAACSLGLEDEARRQFATHVGVHIGMWREALRRSLE